MEISAKLAASQKLPGSGDGQAERKFQLQEVTELTA